LRSKYGLRGECWLRSRPNRRLRSFYRGSKSWPGLWWWRSWTGLRCRWRSGSEWRFSQLFFLCNIWYLSWNWFWWFWWRNKCWARTWRSFGWRGKSWSERRNRWLRNFDWWSQSWPELRWWWGYWRSGTRLWRTFDWR
jgi:hypothetical protein